MNTAKLRSKRVVIGTVAAVAALGIGAAVWTTAASADVRGDERDRVAAAALEAVPGTVTDVETSDDPGEAYEVEVRQEDGTEVDLALDQDLAVVSQRTDRDDDRDDADDRDDVGTSGSAATSGTSATPDADDRALTAEERTAAEQAVLAEFAGGTVTSVEASDDRGVAWDVDVRDAQGAQWDVDLDADLAVVTKTADD